MMALTEQEPFGVQIERIAVLVINYNTAHATAGCVSSLVSSGWKTIWVLDNGSTLSDREALARLLRPHEGVTLTHSSTNLGFAGGANLLMSSPGAGRSVSHYLLINSDCVATTSASLVASNVSDDIHLAGWGLLKPMHTDGRQSQPVAQEIDSMGMTMYMSGIAANRRKAAQRMFGPTGACMLISETLRLDLLRCHGYVFDEDYFCYAEDSDLVGRAIVLGYRPQLIEGFFGSHHGQMSSAKIGDEFIGYHGLRNSIWTVVKVFPLATLPFVLPLLTLVLSGALLRDLRLGRKRSSLLAIVHAIRALPLVLCKRAAVQANRRVSTLHFLRYVSPMLYDFDYLRLQLFRLFKRNRREES